MQYGNMVVQNNGSDDGESWEIPMTFPLFCFENNLLILKKQRLDKRHREHGELSTTFLIP